MPATRQTPYQPPPERCAVPLERRLVSKPPLAPFWPPSRLMAATSLGGAFGFELPACSVSVSWQERAAAAGDGTLVSHIKRQMLLRLWYTTMLILKSN